MLAKQSWRLLQSPESLDYRVLQSNYFPGSDILTANLTDSLSYTWRSLYEGVILLKNGCLRRIGDGSSTHVWLHPWIPDLPNFKPLISPLLGMEDLMICNLIDPYTHN